MRKLDFCGRILTKNYTKLLIILFDYELSKYGREKGT